MTGVVRGTGSTAAKLVRATKAEPVLVQHAGVLAVRRTHVGISFGFVAGCIGIRFKHRAIICQNILKF